MNIFKIAIKGLRHRALNTFLSVLILAFGLGLIMVMLSAQEKFEKLFTKNIEGIDLVVGAKGSPLQLILSSVYQIDAPTGNIPLAEFRKLQKNPMVEKAIPLSFGDNYMGFRIVGTSQDYYEHYELNLENGNWFGSSLEVVLGAEVAEKTGLQIGDEFSGSHGLAEEGETHDEANYKVVGIMAPSGTVADKLILTPLESVWQIHAHNEGESHQHAEHEHDQKREITAGLISYKTAMATMMLPRLVNEKTSMQAAMPAIEINRLFTLAEGLVRFLNALGYLLVFISAISVFTALLQSQKDEEPQLAYLRTLGYSRMKVFSLILLKGLLLGITGFAAAWVLSEVTLYLVDVHLNEQVVATETWYVFRIHHLFLLVLILALTLLSSLWPAWRAYRINISKTLANA